MNRKFFWICTVLIALLLGLNLALKPQAPQPQPSKQDESTGVAAIGGTFELINQRGEPFHSDALKGKPTLIYFGFTHCPAICPADMAVFAAVLKGLGDKADTINAVFVSIDPTRDTPERLNQFLGAVDERIIGLTGSDAAIEQAKKAYKVYGQKNEIAPEMAAQMGLKEPYMIDHSTLTYLMDEKGEYVAHFAHNSDPATIITRIKSLSGN